MNDEEADSGSSKLDYERLDDVTRAQKDNTRHFHRMPQGWRQERCCFKFKHGLLFPFKAAVAYFRRLVHVFGWRFLCFLVVTQFLIKGMLYRMSQSGALPIFKGMGVDAVYLQLYTTVIAAPWAIKPLIGVFSDLFPVGGYHKRFWLIQSIIVGILGGLLLVIGYQAGILILVLCFTAINYEMSICDLLSEGKYSELMRKNPISGSDIITFAQGCQIFGTIVAMSYVGPLADEQLFRVLFFIALAVSFTPMLPTLIGWLPEEKRTPDEPGIRGNRCCMFDMSKFREEKGLFAVVAVSGIGGPVLASVTTFGSRWVGIGVAGVMLTVMMIGAYCTFKERVIANIAMYQLILRIFRPSIGAAMDYFYTADAACLPGGPGFTFKYYITYTGILGAVVSFVAVWIYQALMSKWKFRTVLIVTLIMQCLGGAVDLVIVMRWNIAWGIPDKTFYIMGEAIIENVVGMLYWIPSSAILSKACDKGLEAAIFAFLAGVSNFGGMVSELTGAAIFEAAGIRTVSPNCNFDSLWWLVIVCHITLPLVAGIPATWLIPDIRQTDQLIKGEPAGTEEIQLEEVSEDYEDESYIGVSRMSRRKKKTRDEDEAIQSFVDSSDDAWVTDF